MSIDLQRLFNSRFGVQLVSFIGQATPPVMGYRIAGWIADWLSTRRRSGVIRAMRTNQWVIRGAGLDGPALDRAVLDTLKHSAHSLYTLHHYIRDPLAVRRLVDLNPVARGLVERPEFSGRGLVVAGLHLSNFDFCLQSMCLQGFKAFVLTIPDPQGGRQMEYEMRKRTGMNLVPASISGLKNAVSHLEGGGMVLTGMDRPSPGLKLRPMFFRHPASLPTHHVHLALKAGVPVMIVAARMGTDGCYHVTTSEPLEMEQDVHHEQAVLRNAECLLQEAEKFLRQAPEQWSISLPVWPDLADQTPA